tara:strand:- start:366 stop:479 length:114 start_codon:yes stop_codon:yes gene_type:complete
MIAVIGVAVIMMTVYGIYMSFGPPSKNLTDSFDEHED